MRVRFVGPTDSGDVQQFVDFTVQYRENPALRARVGAVGASGARTASPARQVAPSR